MAPVCMRKLLTLLYAMARRGNRPPTLVRT
jgi:hypothetical protein